ncbi:MAG: YHS domain-containing protein [Thaumarchaeota archaeon]|nr:MAG: YHS domain-containing protein [Nitrososphaerota archaeon]TLX99067.1 MAG: YHS domain-containing protein [Nitrososphaerota archaeon]
MTRRRRSSFLCTKAGTFYFCSASCKQKFESDPQAYLKSR